MLGLWAAVTWQLMGARRGSSWPSRARPRHADGRCAAGCAALAPAFRAALTSIWSRPRPACAPRAGGWACGRRLARRRCDACPPAPLLLLANEFFDALPIRQFIRRDGAWPERHVADGRFLDLPAETPPPLPAEDAEGAMPSMPSARMAVAAGRAARCRDQGGARSALDYGPAAAGPATACRP